MFVAALTALLAGCLYLATLQPDFGGPEDTPKFQFVGHVLGTPHPPGYPLYVVLSHLFVKSVRLGTVAYRANLFSAVMAVAACVLVFAIARVLGSSRWSAAGAALAMAAGASFWRSAVFAEVYSLGAAAAAASLCCVLVWGIRDGGARWLLAGIGATSAAFGNHLTIVGVVPAYVAYVLWRNPRVLRPRFLAAALLLITLGLGQYYFIVLRTMQGAPYLESRATEVHGLIDVVLARHFENQRFNYAWRTILTIHLPVVAATIRQELAAPGLALLLIGAVAVARRRPAAAALLCGAGAGMLVMVLNIGGDVRGFITPVMVFLWPFAACGADAAGGLAGRWLGRPAAAAVLTGALALLMPAANVTANYQEADQSRNTGTARVLQALHQQLPAQAGFVTEDYFFDMAMRYFRFTGEPPGARPLNAVSYDAGAVRAAAHPGGGSEARPVFAFAGAVTFLATEGMRFVPAPLRGPALQEWLQDLPPGFVLVGATAYLPGPLDLAPAGHPDVRPPGRAQNFETFAIVVGQRGQRWHKHHVASSLVVDAPTVGAVLPEFGGTLRAMADEQGVRVTVDARTIVAAPDGVVLALFDPQGRLVRDVHLDAEGPYHVPFPAAVYRYAGENPCVTLTSAAWSDVSAVFATGSAVTTPNVPGTATVLTRFAAPSVAHRTAGILGDAIGRDVEDGRDAGGAFVWRSELRRTGGRRSVFRLAIDQPGVEAAARVEPGSPEPLKLCAFSPPPILGAGREAAMVPANFESEAYFGPGWSGAQMADTGRVRHGSARATLLLPLPPATYRLRLDLSALSGTQTIATHDGRPVGTCAPAEPGGCTFVFTAVPEKPVTALTLISQAPAPPPSADQVLVLRGARIDRQVSR